MSSIAQRLEALKGVWRNNEEWMERFSCEIGFACGLAERDPAGGDAAGMVDAALRLVEEAASAGTSLPAAVQEAEKVLAPLRPLAEEYTIHCAGHAHIDMNWMWSWPETVGVVNDTFTTMDLLMDEFPDFRFTQSQASVYVILKEYLPELYERVKQRIAEGRWDLPIKAKAKQEARQ